MELVVLSGKGGTGKTSLVGALAALADNKVMVDCDVDAADLHLLLNPEERESHDFICSSRAVIDMDKCMVCGICTPYCRFDAIKNEPDSSAKFGEIFRVDRYACEGCGVCTHFCPENAIGMDEVISGRWFVSETDYGPLVHARLGIAEANSGRLVSLLRLKAAEIAMGDNLGLIITDGPPGIGCPVIASLTGADLAVVVTEPSLSAIHDMERLLRLAGHFHIPTGICINKYDINPGLADSIEDFAANAGSEVLGRIPYDAQFTKAQLEGMPLTQFADNGVSREVRAVWDRLQDRLASLRSRNEMNNNRFLNIRLQ